MVGHHESFLRLFCETIFTVLHGSCTLMAKEVLFFDLKWELTDGTDGHDMGTVKEEMKRRKTKGW